MYAGIEYRWKKVVGNACLSFYVLTKITMIKTKSEIERDNKLRLELEELTLEINQLNTKIESKQREINRLPSCKLKLLKWLVEERVEMENKRNYLETKRNEKVNLINTLP